MRGTINVTDSSVNFWSGEKVAHNKKQYPFNDLYWQIINLFKSKGFQVGYNEYYTGQWKALKNSYYKATKGNLWVLFHRYPAGFSIEIGFARNEMLGTLYPRYHDKYIKNTYLEEKQIQLCIKHILGFFSKIEVNIKPSEPKNEIEKLFYKEKINSHIHGGAQSFEELKAYCENMPHYNSKDANGVPLKCGQTKYAYLRRFGNRLCRVEVWHNINNMWWGIVNGVMCNYASFEYFDYQPNLPQKNPRIAICKLESLIKKYSQEKNFVKCVILQKKLEELTKTA